MSHKHWMQQAIDLAKQGWFTTRPNPRVGCVLVRNGQVLGQGFHRVAGEAHAEIHALNDAQNKGLDVAGCTAYVTLEPCSHTGRTPPCSLALIQAKVAHVVIGHVDPNPLVAGNGVAMLTAAGIEVKVGVLAEQCRALNPDFCHAMAHQRPKVLLKVATSLDGATAMNNGTSQWITSAEARRDVHQQRLLSDAIVTAIGTVQADNPYLNVRLDDHFVAQYHIPSHLLTPKRVCLDTRAEVDLDQHIFQQSGDVIWVVAEDQVHRATSKLQQANLTARVQLLALPLNAQQRFELASLHQILFTDHGVHRLWVESGASLVGDYLQQGAFDELWHYQAPDLMGNHTQPLAVLPRLLQMSDKIRLSYAQVDRLGRDLRQILVADMPSSFT